MEPDPLTELDEFALASHERAVKAIKDGHFTGEIVPVGDGRHGRGPGGTPASTPRESSASQRPGRAGHRQQRQLAQRRGGRVVVIASEAYVERHGLQPRARIVASASPESPRDHGDRPGPGHPQGARPGRLVDLRPRRGRAERGLRLPVARQHRDLGLDSETVNADGGAVALGHPLGASGRGSCSPSSVASSGPTRGVVWPPCAWAWARAPPCSWSAHDQTGARRGPRMSGEPLLVEEADDRVVLRLNRPRSATRSTSHTVEALHAACARLEERPRVALLVGSGGTFAAGADIGQLRERRRDDALRGINSGVFDRMRHLPMPTIALIDGYALSGGAELTYACDFQIGRPARDPAIPETRLGILAAAGAAWRLAELVGEPVAKEISWPDGSSTPTRRTLRLLNGVVK